MAAKNKRFQEEGAEISQRLFHELEKFIEFHKGSVQWLEGNNRQLIGVHGFAKEGYQARLLRPVDTDPIIEEIVRKQDYRIISDTNHSVNWEKQRATADVNSWVGWALVHDGKSVGLLTLDHREPNYYREFGPELVEHLDKRISQAASDLNAAYQRAQKQREMESLAIHDRGLELIISIGKKLLQAADIHAVLNAIVSGAMELTHTESGVIFLLNSEGTEVLDTFQRQGFEHPAPRLNESAGITKHVIETKMPVLISSIQDDLRVNPVLKKKYRSMFAIPLVLDDFVIGVLYLNGTTERDLTVVEKSLLATLADQAALGVQIKNSQAMYNAIPQCVTLKDTQSRIRAANASFCNTLRNPPGALKEKDIVGKRDTAFYKENIAEDYVAKDRFVIESRTTFRGEELHQSPLMAEPAWFHVVKSPVFGSNAEVIGVQAIFWDVTEQKRDRERWEALVQQSPDGIVVHRHGKITLANAAARILFGVTPVEPLEDRSILDFVDTKYFAMASERLQRLMRKEEIAPMVQMHLRQKSGKMVDVEVYARPVPDSDEVQVILHDLTRRNELLAQINAHAERSKDVMEIAAHEMRSPLNKILNHLTVWRRDVENGVGDIADLSVKIEEQVMLAKRMADNALAFDREIVYTYSMGELYSLVRESCQEFQSKAEDIDVSFDIHPQVLNLPEICMDVDRIKQVIGNLVHNAVKYSLKGCLIRIYGAESGDSVHLYIENVAYEMPRALQKSFFNQKKDMAPDEKRFIAGAGLGCPIIKTIVTGHGGEVSLQVSPQVHVASKKKTVAGLPEMAESVVRVGVKLPKRQMV